MVASISGVWVGKAHAEGGADGRSLPPSVYTGRTDCLQGVQASQAASQEGRSQAGAVLSLAGNSIFSMFYSLGSHRDSPRFKDLEDHTGLKILLKAVLKNTIYHKSFELFIYSEQLSNVKKWAGSLTF